MEKKNYNRIKSAIRLAMEEKNFVEFANILDQNPELVDMRINVCGDYLLHYAVKTNNEDALRLLLCIEGIDVNIKNTLPYEESALLIAARYGYLEIAEMLLKVDEIDVNSCNILGENSLMVSSKYSYVRENVSSMRMMDEAIADMKPSRRFREAGISWDKVIEDPVYACEIYEINREDFCYSFKMEAAEDKAEAEYQSRQREREARIAEEQARRDQEPKSQGFWGFVKSLF